MTPTQFHDFQEQICCRWQRLFQQVKVALILPITETGGDPHLSVESVSDFFRHCFIISAGNMLHP